MTTAIEIGVGQVIALTSGEYSSYRVISFAKVLKPINAAVWDEMVKACTTRHELYPEEPPYFDDEKATPWFVDQGYIEDVEYTELHLDDDGQGKAFTWEEA